MKIIKLLYLKYAISFFICLFSGFIIFFIFSLISNLNEDYLFKIIINLSILNSFQILTYVPTFIFLISIILLVIFLRSKNEIIIIKSYLSMKKLIIFFIPVIFIFTFIEINKNNLSDYFESYKIRLIDNENNPKTKIIISNSKIEKNFKILKNLDLKKIEDTEYYSFNIFDKKIKLAEFSNDLKLSNNNILLNNFTLYKDDIIEDFNQQKLINLNFINLINEKSLVKNITKNDQKKFDIKLINLICFFILYLTFILLYFFNTRFVNSKESLKNPILICLSIIVYSFFIFNNSLSAYKQEFELLSSMIMGILFIKAYLNE